MLRRRKPALVEVTIGPDLVPQSPCQKCRRLGKISSCERKGGWEIYTFVCDRCQRRWGRAL